MARKIRQIAAEIRQTWKPKVNYAAKPYLDAMETLDKITDNYYLDSADDVVRRFLANAGSWRGDDARRIKAELKRHLDGTAGVTRTVKHLERLRNTTIGNARWKVHFTDGSHALTADNSHIALVIDSSEYHGVPVEITFNKAGKITHVVPA
jgi:hypothetical protein